MGYEVTFLCTGKGKHAPREFGPILDLRDRVDLIQTLTPHAGWTGPLTDHRRQRERTAASGAQIVSRSTSVWILTDESGKRAFHIEPCPSCEKRPGPGGAPPRRARRPKLVPELTMLKLLDSIYAAPDTRELFDISYWGI